ncbi:type I-E CRISPR-associated protein Cas6/Cse3/CasE [Methanocella arvoryzae]|uniref:Predicted CRISPR-associated protein n=1 Tax=Methanocella arvoryzae (strain DSM 22066 / NBRC 105507 / MRE50) TaxID=351160 RepID=Q0W583_METAR|nr:type I-E CRISPR-associated protein Cas6/Cse3/CasE [Methanocella arvoryzae]CAJ36460.1 predicted CRISPR-associated protein [Methanocella arvoryzae MRE50]
MYLSRLILNPRTRAVRRDLADCHELHRTILGGFPDLNGKGGEARETFGVLHRIDIHPRSGAIVLLVQSQEKPDWSKLPEGYLLENTGTENPACKAIDEQYGKIKAGDVYAFRLRANPTKKIGTSRIEDIKAGKPKNNGRRVPIRNESDQILWLKRKGAAGGFELMSTKRFSELSDVLISEEGHQKIYTFDTGIKAKVQKNARENRLTFGSVLFEGTLKVTNAEKFLETLKSGIGSGKAYGFGLLSLAPAR